MTLIPEDAHPGCDSCTAYANAIKTLLADWHAAGAPKGPSTYSGQIGLGLAMYLEHLGEHLPA
ncbi:hypothetical protein ABT264_35175 [Streptomyces virginiae]|uniref:hypothetical protein n=1 Tax=Streptomyces virginiae TaxID=1961 RepID=UPI0033340A5B